MKTPHTRATKPTDKPSTSRLHTTCTHVRAYPRTHAPLSPLASLPQAHRYQPTPTPNPSQTTPPTSPHQEGLRELKTEVELGGEVYCAAHVPDTSRVFISIGLGFHLEVALGEAPRVIGLRKQALQHKVRGATGVAGVLGCIIIRVRPAPGACKPWEPVGWRPGVCRSKCEAGPGPGLGPQGSQGGSTGQSGNSCTRCWGRELKVLSRARVDGITMGCSLAGITTCEHNAGT